MCIRDSFISGSVTHDDKWAADQLLSKLAGLTVEVYLGTVEDVLYAISNLDLMIGTRLHANIIAAYFGVPCIGINYRPKVSRFFVDNNLTEYCVDIGQKHQLSAVVETVLRNYATVRRQYRHVGSENAKRADIYYRLSSEIMNA